MDQKKKSASKRKSSYYSSGGGFHTKEAYKSLRTNIQFLLFNGKNNIIAFTSSNIGEGKSTTTINTAITMVESGARVLVIDADLRRPVVHKMMDMNIVPGLTNYLSGKNTIDEVLRPSSYPRLDICTCGALPPNPAELVGSEQMIEFLKTVSKRYDYVFIDTPPVTIVTDSLVLAKHIAGYVFVVRQRIADSDTFRYAIQRFELVDARILGIVFNDVKTDEAGYGYYKKYGYYRKKYGKNGEYSRYYSYRGYYGSDKETLDSVPNITPAEKPNIE